jgi:hypothetical protein
MNGIWITQVFGLKQFLKITQLFLKNLSNLFWINENQFETFPETKISLKYGWVIGLYKYRNKAVKNAVWQMKYRSNRKVARFFGKEMAKTLIDSELQDYILVPIPIHWRRRLERGFNQSEWLCEEIFKAFNKNNFQPNRR